MNIGYIYKITNKINNKCYIGQTIQFLEQRWKDHKKIYNNSNSKLYDFPLYKAFRKYGLENFIFEKIDECNIDELDDKEIYWIAFYDSYKNGYNQTLGGGGGKIYDLDEKEIINKYEELRSMQKVANLFHCSITPIKSILLKNGIKILSSEEVAQNYNHKTICKDDNGNIIKEFKSIADAAKWISGATNRKDYRITHSTILRAILNNKKYFGYFWDSDEYSQEEKNERTKNTYDYEKSHKYYIDKKNKECPNCGKLIHIKSNLCKTCFNKQNGNKALKEKEKRHGVNKDILKKEIRTTSFTELGKKYNVSDNTIKKWCKTYNLPYKKSDINNYSDKEWEDI